MGSAVKVLEPSWRPGYGGSSPKECAERCSKGETDPTLTGPDSALQTGKCNSFTFCDRGADMILRYDCMLHNDIVTGEEELSESATCTTYRRRGEPSK